MIVARAPLRLSIGGGGTDLPFYASRYGGSLVTAAINKYIHIIVSKRVFYNESLLKYSKTEVVRNVKDIQHSRIRAALEHLNINEPVEIVSVSDVPAETGLGSSSAFLVALLKALHIYKKEEISAVEIAEEASFIEMKILGEQSGKQDAYASALGGIIHLDISKEGLVKVNPLKMSYSSFEELENNTLLFSTGISHSANEIILEQKSSLEKDSAKMEQMHDTKLIGEKIKECLENGGVNKFGELLNQHWETKKKFTPSMTNKIIDSYYSIGLKNGAIGGKLVGAGGGGFILLYCENNKRKVRNSLNECGLKELPFRFDMDGCKGVYIS